MKLTIEQKQQIEQLKESEFKLNKNERDLPRICIIGYFPNGEIKRFVIWKADLQNLVKLLMSKGAFMVYQGLTVAHQTHTFKKERSLLELVKLLHQLGELKGYPCGLCDQIDYIIPRLLNAGLPVITVMDKWRLEKFILESLSIKIGLPIKYGYYWDAREKEPRQEFLQGLIDELEKEER